MEVSASSDVTDVRPDMQFDVQRLDAYLRAHVAQYRGPLRVHQFRGGQSNPTYLLSTPGRRYVLRRKPPGRLLAFAHAIEREYAVLAALGGHTDVPVPKTFALCTDDAVIGTWFYVMEEVVGRVFWDTSFPDVPGSNRAAYFDAMNTTLASLHRVDYAAVGLESFGRPAAYVERQVARWSSQYQEAAEAGRIAAMDRLAEWLSASVPHDEEAAVVHGDYRCDNLVFHPSEPRVLAILDWELSTIGHPLADFAYHLMMYRMPTLGVAGLLGHDLAARSIPEEERYVADYCRRTGRDSIPDLDFFLAFCFFRLAGILHGIRARLIRGTAVSARAREYAQYTEAVAELGWRQAERAMRRGGGD